MFVQMNVLISNLPLKMRVPSGKDELFWKFGAHNPSLSHNNHWLRYIGGRILLKLEKKRSQDL